jgi:hypothetical protein
LFHGADAPFVQMGRAASKPVADVRTYVTTWGELALWRFLPAISSFARDLDKHRARKNKKKSKSGTMYNPNGASASAPRAGRNGRGRIPATREAGGSARAERERRKSPAANTRKPTGTASSAAVAPTNQQERTTQHHSGSGGSPAGRRKEPGARACNVRERNLRQRSPYDPPGAHARERAPQAAGGPTGPPRDHLGAVKHAGERCN